MNKTELKGINIFSCSKEDLLKGDHHWRKLHEALAYHEPCLPSTSICAPLCNFFELQTENTQTSIWLGRWDVTCCVQQRWVERNLSPAVSLHICFLWYNHDSLQTSCSSAPSLSWKTLSIVLGCHWDIFISCSAPTSSTHMQRQGKSACLCGHGSASLACVLTHPPKKKIHVTFVTECFGSASEMWIWQGVIES